MNANIAILKGYSREIVAISNPIERTLLIKPDTDLDAWDGFMAWDVFEKSFIVFMRRQYGAVYRTVKDHQIFGDCDDHAPQI